VSDTSGSVRLFAALSLTSAVRDALVDVQAQMRRRAERGRATPRFIEPGALHVTLKFFGWTDVAHVERLSVAVTALAATTRIPTQLSRVIALGKVRRARIVAAELTDAEGRMAALAERFEVEGEAIGIARETRRFLPHVTLIRIKRPCDVGDWLNAAQLPTLETTLDEVVLYQSILHPTGAEYRALATARLGAS
jgi:2'-5' RNA ligase